MGPALVRLEACWRGTSSSSLSIMIVSDLAWSPDEDATFDGLAIWEASG